MHAAMVMLDHGGALLLRNIGPTTLESRLRIHRNMQVPYGDRRQEIVLIGIRMDKTALTKMLDMALVTDEEYALGPAGWGAYPDPLASASELTSAAR
jgi:hypothetical protein